MVKIASRGSKLALWQANYVKDLLMTLGYEASIHVIKTKGDLIQNVSFDKLEGKGFFTKEIEEALLRRQCDIAVHSLKDLPTSSPPDLCLSGYSERVNAADCLICKKTHPLFKGSWPMFLQNELVVGTSSARRVVQLKSIAPHVTFTAIRGNVPTRLEKLKSNHCDVIVLAKAGIERLALDMSDFIIFDLSPHEMVPAPAQGVLGYQCRRDDHKTIDIIKKISNSQSALLSGMERELLHKIEGGCQTPFGAYCQLDSDGNYRFFAAYAPDVDAPLQRVTITQSSHIQLVNNIFNQLKICI